MKNKKLFAILTLVCFMFTLMPVAAFAADSYAEVDSEYDIVKIDETSKNAKVVLNVTGDVAATQCYVYAVKADGTLYTSLERADKATTGTAGVLLYGAGAIKEVYFKDAGEYTVYVTPKTTAMENIVTNTTEIRTKAQILALLLDEKVTMLDNNVTVKPVDSSYALTLAGDANATTANGVTTYSVDVDANSGYATKTIKATLTNNNDPVVGATLKISTNSSAVDVNKTEVTTNAAGIATFKVSASTAGDFKVYVEYGTKADATLNVDAGTLDPAKITNIYAPTIPLALDSTMSGTEFTYTIVDANGNNIEGVYDATDKYVAAAPMVKDTNYKVVVTEKPAGSSLDGDDDIVLSYDPTSATWYLDGDATFDEEGNYTIKITLDNGNYATASVTVKEFQTPVELKMTYKQEAVELNGEAVLNKLFYVDANGVKKNVKNKIDGEVVLSATGYAIADFEADNTNAKAGLVTVKDDEKYVGSVITVLAVSEKYNLTASVELVVANEAVAVKYATTTADVAVNNTLTANIVDQDGRKVALNDTIGKANISYVVLGQPEGSKVAISTLADELAAKGQFKVSFTASEIGTYKVQTVVRYEQGADEVVKYYTGIEEITVGNTGFEDIVVMSVGSNEIVVNAETKAIDAAPMIANNRTFVPFRALAEAFGAEVAYDEATQAVTAELNGTTVVMTIGSATYTVNGVEKTADVAPFINGSRTMVPVRFVAEEFGIKVTPTYDENGATADILFAK